MNKGGLNVYFHRLTGWSENASWLKNPVNWLILIDTLLQKRTRMNRNRPGAKSKVDNVACRIDMHQRLG